MDTDDLFETIPDNSTADGVDTTSDSANIMPDIPQEEINLQATVQFLKPFYETTNVLSGSTYTTLGISILLIDDIVDNISSCILNPESPEFLKTAATQMSEKIQKYANEIYDKTAFIAAVLDPRIKLELMPADMNTEANCTIFNNILRAEYATLILNNPSASHTSSTSSISLTSSTSLTSSASSISSTSPTNLKAPSNLTYTEQIAQKKRKSTNSTNKTDELTQYLSEAVLPMNVDPLSWWKLNCTRFPYLSQMARDYLAIQSTSVPSEQVFSKAGDTVRARRARLSEKSLQALMCINSWLKHGIKFRKE